MILPERVFGRSAVNRMSSGPRDRADLLDDVLLEIVDQLLRPSRSPAPSFRVTNAAIAWPLISCARPTTAASATAG